MTQHVLYGYRLHGNDESVSEWVFYDKQMLGEVHLNLRLRNGAVVSFIGLPGMDLERWAQAREIDVERVKYFFDPQTMTFTRVTP